MTFAVLYTVLAFPLYLLLRYPFRRLPLHTDTGFYVSNHTICTRRFRFSEGWNARYAGCSKVIPEFFYSLVYLAHSPKDATIGSTRMGYKEWSRLWASVYNFLTAICVGILCSLFADGSPVHYVTGLTVFALLSTECQYGVYFECAELFEILFEVAGIAVFLLGMQMYNLALITLGALLWAAAACFVKLSAAVAALVVYSCVVAMNPSALFGVVCGAGVVFVGFIVWVHVNGGRPIQQFQALRGHEAAFDQWANGHGWRHRLEEKTRTLLRAVGREPIIPILALVGAVFGGSLPALVWVYSIAVAVAYVAQATDCRYYLIPLLPPMAIFASHGVHWLLGAGVIGQSAVVLLAAAWLVRNPLRAGWLDMRRLNEWCWRGFRSSWDAQRNAEWERAAGNVRHLCKGDPFLIYGPANQIYALAGVSYTTAIVTPEHYLDHVAPQWQREHNDRMVNHLAHWILDTDRCFDAAEARQRLGLDYRMTHILPGDGRLYELGRVEAAPTEYRDARTFQPQSTIQLEREEAMGEGTRVDLRIERESCMAGVDPAAAALTGLLAEIARRGHKRVAVYGAGRFTLRHADVYRGSSIPVTLVLDDNAQLSGRKLLDWPIQSPHEADTSQFDAVVISTDRFSIPMLSRARQLWGDRIPAYTFGPPMNP